MTFEKDCVIIYIRSYFVEIFRIFFVKDTMNEEKTTPPKIGIVLAGGMSKVAYEIGCLQAISEYFGKEQIVAISASSIGTLAGYACSVGKLSEMTEKWEQLNTNQRTGSMLRLAKNKDAINLFLPLIGEHDTFSCNLYNTVWNYTRSSVDYVSIPELNYKKRVDFMLASIALPVINKAIRIDGELYFDGAFLDNIPVLPFLKTDLDYIFCIYFDGWNYQFENPSFDKKIIKLNHFPEKSGLDFLVYDSSQIKDMITYAYHYTANTIHELFATPIKENVYAAIQNRNINSKNRITTEILLTNVNKAMGWLSKRNIF